MYFSEIEPIEWCDACLDHRIVSSRQRFERLGMQRIDIRFRIIAEITTNNLKHFDGLRAFPNIQIRHIDGIRTNFAIVDGNLFFGRTLSSPVHTDGFTGDAKELVEAYQLLFERLWEDATPAEIKIEQIKTNLPMEKTDIFDIFYGQETIIKTFLHDLKYVKERFDSCTDFTGPSLFVDTLIWLDYSKLNRKGIKLRFITDVTRDNIKQCKRLIEVCELRHLDKVKGNFGIIDGRSYGAGSSPTPGQALTQVIRSTVKTFVEQQQYAFDSLWNSAVPAMQRIEQLQLG
jgi:hypothetical protein